MTPSLLELLIAAKNHILVASEKETFAPKYYLTQHNKKGHRKVNCNVDIADSETFKCKICNELGLRKLQVVSEMSLKNRQFCEI